VALETYRKKRNFRTTPEPMGGRIARRTSGDLRFVIQKHAASRLHYDFRLELDGVLLSWAVPKGPSLDPSERRLAMHVEDHPMEYGDFEGIIPPKQYGSGTVMLWDRGTWSPKSDPAEGYRKGRLKFELHGEKLSGGWNLVRIRGGKYGDKDGKAWLLIKENDDSARTNGRHPVVEEEPDSVTTGRSLDEIAASGDRVWHSNKSVAENVKGGAVKNVRSTRSKKKPAERAARGTPGRRWKRPPFPEIEGAVKAALPAFVEPELATLVKQTPGDAEWLHEMKLDGYRMLARVERGAVRMYTRNRKDWTATFPAIAQAVAKLPVETAWLDGEVVVLQANGLTSFQALQNALSRDDRGRLHYYLFDLPYLDGYDLRKVPLVTRKGILEQLLRTGDGTLRYSSHVAGMGDRFFAQACRMKLEGVIAKRAASSYRAGRGRDWLKIKCFMRQEMVIGGYTDPERSRKGFGALHLGVYEDGSLKYCGKVGTGFDDRTLVALRDRLGALEQEAPPFADPPRGAEARRSHWVKPELVCEVLFTEWTDDGTLRHPSFQGLREDKAAREVVRERPASGSDPQGAEDTSETASGSDPREERDMPASGKRRKAIRRKATARKTRPRSRAAAGSNSRIAGITISNPDKILYPEAGITKRELALFYEAVGDRIVPQLRDRPLTLVRCPNGWRKHCFYQKHVKEGVPDVIDRVKVPEGKGQATYMMANSLSAVVALVQMGVAELHPWGSTAKKLGHADRIVMDFDPDDGLPWSSMVDAVELMRKFLDELGLAGFLKTTGGKGLHVVVPIRPTQTWETIKAFTKAISESFATTFPDRFTSIMSKDKRRGKIYIDYLRNAEGATAVAAWSARARENAPVATPIAWEELREDVRFGYFNVRNVPGRLARMRKDPWSDFFRISQSVTAAMIKRVG
jgi:bifunctional non-homologous end joining protein LigD